MTVLPETRRELERIKALHLNLSKRLTELRHQIEAIEASQAGMASQVETLGDAYHETLRAVLDVSDAITNGLNRGWEDESPC